MSGISEIKNKAKMSIDEMYEIPHPKVDYQKTISLEKKPPIQPEITSSHVENKNIHYAAEPNSQVSINEERLSQPPIFHTAAKQQQKIPGYKMTFNLTEEVYKAFNDLYAKRLLQGRKTEKSEMICEAIQWLVNMEK